MEKLTTYRDYEGIMIHLAERQNWQFRFEDEKILVNTVFNASTYGPPLLFAAQDEMRRRHVPAQLGVVLNGESRSLFGAKVSFVLTENAILSQFWRIAISAQLVRSLPRQDNHIQLDPLRYILGDTYSAFLGAGLATPEVQ